MGGAATFITTAILVTKVTVYFMGTIIKTGRVKSKATCGYSIAKALYSHSVS